MGFFSLTFFPPVKKQSYSNTDLADQIQAQSEISRANYETWHFEVYVRCISMLMALLGSSECQ